MNKESLEVNLLKKQIKTLEKKLKGLERSSDILSKAELAAGTGSWEMSIPSGRIEASDGTRNIFGLEQKTIYIKDILNVPLPEFRPIIDKALKDLIEKDIPVNMEIKIKNKIDQRIIDVHLICEFDKENGKIIGTIQDVTKKNQEEELLRNEYSTLLKITMDVLESSERKRALQIILEGATRLISLDTGALYLEKDGELIPEAAYPASEFDNVEPAKLIDHPHIMKALETRKPILIRSITEEPLSSEERKISMERNLQSILFIPLIAFKKPVGVMILGSTGRMANLTSKEIDIPFTLSNIGSLALENSMLSEKFRLLSRAVEQSPVSIIVTNSKGIIEYANKKFSELTGYTSGESIGKTPGILKSGYQSKEFYKELWNTIKSGRNWEGEMMNRKKNGDMYWESVLISPMIDDTGRITHYIGVKEDISEKKANLERLIEARDKAEESTRLKTAFIHNISHEIRTPLNSIVGFTEFLTDTHLTDEKRKIFTDIVKLSSENLLTIVDGIMRISQIETGQVTVNVSEISIEKLLVTLYNQYKISAESKNIKLELSLRGISEETTIITDVGKLKQILINLLDNAIKFTHEGSIEVEVDIKGDNIFFKITDTGIGIPEQEQERIFERFYQTKKTGSFMYGGTGIGLSISQSYATLLGGVITVNPGKNTGSEFTLMLPLHFDK